MNDRRRGEGVENTIGREKSGERGIMEEVGGSKIDVLP